MNKQVKDSKIFNYSYWMAFDVDDTLIMWEEGSCWYFNPEHIEQMQRAKFRGQGVIIWTAGGLSWLKKVKDLFEVNDYDQYVDKYMTKPGHCFDDKEFYEWSSIGFKRPKEGK